jgi:hypothetical protein
MSRKLAALALAPLTAFTLAACSGETHAEGSPGSVAEFASQFEENDALAARVAAAWNAEPPQIAVYKTPTCGCCQGWVDHVEKAGFHTEVLDLQSLASIKQQAGIPSDLASCHTSMVDGYFVEGHVPADAIQRLLSERPDIAGIAVPGMPMGTPGMEGSYRQPYDIIAVGHDGSRTVFESRR